MHRIRSVTRLPAALVAASVLLLSACTYSEDLHKPPVPLGDFRLGHNVVVASKMRKGPLSRHVEEEEMVQAVTAAVEERFRRYDGSGLYHLGISIEGYVIAAPGVPLLLKPRSALITNVTLWDDKANKKLTEEPKRIEVLESFNEETFIGSGLTMAREEQLQNVARNIAKEIQNWLEENPQWFEATPEEIAADEAERAKASSSARKDAPRYFGEGVTYDPEAILAAEEAAEAKAEAAERAADAAEQGNALGADPILLPDSAE
ncbi:hypothetical protein [Pseudooceanicola sp. HF7]|uniref:hypothetical protein n=1 Tax=Pseudooceanicola sp. HF7 TaxID=2721560 RepID=UPI00158BBD2B|nr:hypothetical protein [Pseudooceanicola sp. HF7]